MHHDWLCRVLWDPHYCALIPGYVRRRSRWWHIGVSSLILQTPSAPLQDRTVCMRSAPCSGIWWIARNRSVQDQTGELQWYPIQLSPSGPSADFATGWPWIFFIEGVVTVCFGLFALRYLPHTPAQSMFLTEQERQVAVCRMKQDSQGAMVADDARDERFHWHWVRLALKSPNTIICSLAWFFLLVPIYVGVLFLRGPLW
jgi:hypothetical protein